MLRSSNPALGEKSFAAERATDGRAMTLTGSAHKTLILLAICGIGVTYSWKTMMQQGPEAAMPWMLGGAIGGLVVALITIFKHSWAPFTAPVYAALEGLFLGAVSAAYSQAYNGIALQAVGLTLCVFLLMLTLYATRIIQPTRKFVLGVTAATGAIFLFYLVSMVMGFFGVQMPLLHSSGPIGIGISLVIVAVAALNLILDFGLIESGVRRGAPKYMEWYGAFALMVTLVWLYLEMLRLLAKINRR